MIRAAALTDEVQIFTKWDQQPDSVFGDPVFNFDTAEIVRAFVSPLDATEDEVNRDVRLNRYMVIFETDTFIDGLSEIAWNGERYTVQGEPKLYSSRRGGHHYEVEIKGVEG